MSTTVTGWKGFDKDLRCKDTQYAVGKTVEEPSAELCERGIHFCEGEWVYGRHQRPGGFRRDAEKFSLAAAQGYRVMRVTGSMVTSGEALTLIEQALSFKEAS